MCDSVGIMRVLYQHVTVSRDQVGANDTEYD